MQQIIEGEVISNGHPQPKPNGRIGTLETEVAELKWYLAEAMEYLAQMRWCIAEANHQAKAVREAVIRKALEDPAGREAFIAQLANQSLKGHPCS